MACEFHTAVPVVSKLKQPVEKLKNLVDNSIQIFMQLDAMVYNNLG